MSNYSNDKSTFKVFAQDAGLEVINGTFEVSGTTVRNVKGRGVIESTSGSFISASFTTWGGVPAIKLPLNKRYPDKQFATFFAELEGRSGVFRTDSLSVKVLDLDVTGSTEANGPAVYLGLTASGSYDSSLTSGASGTNRYQRIMFTGIIKSYGPAV